MIKWIRGHIFRSEFNKNVAKLVSGTVSANVITVLFLPILTRLYSVDDFGQFQLLLSVALIITVISTLKYEMTIPLPKNKSDSDALFLIAFLFLIFISSGLFIILYYFGKPILNLFDAGHLSAYRWWISFAVLFGGGFELMNYVYMRNKLFGLMAKYRILQVAIIQGISLAYGVVSPDFSGLLYAYLAGNGFVAIIMYVKSNVSIKHVKIRYALFQAMRFKKFPMINAPMALVNTFSMQLPVFMLSAYFSPEIVGFYMMANKMITMPMNLISRSVGRVYYQSASSAIHKGKYRILRIFNQTVRRIVKVGIIPAIIILVFSPTLVTIILGAQWSQAGVFMQIMIPWLFFQFINLPISTTFSLIRRQEIGFLLIVISVFAKYVAMEYWHTTPSIQLWALTIVSSLFYITYTFTSYSILKRVKK
ncbi:MAG: oligosaccharide flippase family protein [Candidatus Marinimicrobia bacterium]|nr:oligosaccharide flippase family protein [Candidatus Neomarinimicrobiota bacterium]